MIVSAVVLIGIGGSVIKPCISGTVQKTAGARATLGFAIFYMVINIGSLFGRGTAFVVRNGSGLATTVAVVAVCSLAAFGLVMLVRSTTKAERTSKDVWAATAGFTAIVVLAGITISWIYGSRGAERAVAGAANLSYIFAVSAMACVVAFFTVLFFYREPATAADPAKPKRSIGRILADMVLVLGSLRFALFLVVMAGFFFIYNQVYNVLPLYVKKVVETNPAMDLYTAANPFVIVCFQLLITRTFGKMRPIRSMVVGTIVIGVAMLINLSPIYMAGGIRAIAANWLPIASVFIVLTVALIAIGELFTSARMYEYIGALAPKGQEGLFLGYANLPLALGAMVGGPVGAVIFNKIMARGATTRPDGLLELVPANNMAGWLVLMGIGLVSAGSLWTFNRWVERAERQPRVSARATPAAGQNAPIGVTILGGLSVALAVVYLLSFARSFMIADGPMREASSLAIVLFSGLAAGWTLLQVSVGLQMIRGRSWARGVFIVAFPTLWALIASAAFTPEVLAANVICWFVGIALLTRPSAMAFFNED
jgi:dipeptide/tripeptide permease